MSAIPITSRQMTLEEYLEFDFNAEGRYEYFDGEVFEMSGGSPEHSLLGNRIGFLLQRELFQQDCSVYNSEVQIKVPALLPYRYGDVSALCGEPIYEDLGNQKLLVNPSLIVEVLSSSTEEFDRDLKFRAYKSIESLREYLLVSQSRKFVTLYTKHNEKFWFQSEYVEGEALKLESLECDLSVEEVYQGII
ncbi:MAG: Uma2 family endonuclease [Acidobacteria bacterium]|jgi:Uma2 family endonuclease|nr:Uma2 family endonuclease [Acidobacteriota bacterium]